MALPRVDLGKAWVLLSFLKKRLRTRLARFWRKVSFLESLTVSGNSAMRCSIRYKRLMSMTKYLASFTPIFSASTNFLR